MAWCGTVVAPVLMHWSCCSLALCQQCQYASCFMHMLLCACRWLGVELWWLQCWCTVVAAVLHWAINMSTQVGLHVCYWCPYWCLGAEQGMHWSCCSLVLGHQCDCLSCSVHLLSSCHFYADGLAWNCGSSSADALGLLQSCAGLRESARVALCTCYHAVIFILMAWHGTAVAPVLAHWNCCSVALSHQDELTIWTTRLLSWSYWCTAVVMVLRWAIGWSTPVDLYVCCLGPMLILMVCVVNVVAPVLAHWSCCFLFAGSLAWAYKMICTNIAMVILMAWCGTVVAPVLMHWSWCSLALGHQHQYASCFIHMLPCYHGHIDGLTWNCGSSSADALELLQSCAGSSVWVYKLFIHSFPWSYWWRGVELW